MSKLISNIKNINRYILNPYHNVVEKYSKNEKWKILLSALLYSLVFALCIATPTVFLIDEYIVPLKPNIIEFPFVVFFFLAVISAPILEELAFRLPLKFDTNILMIFDSKDKIEQFWIKYFKPIFYFIAFSFAILHAVSNFNNSGIVFYLVAPFIVFSQGFGGLILGYIRMHLGFWWGVLHHLLFNFTVIILTTFFFHNKLNFEEKSNTFSVKMYDLQYYENNPIKQVEFDKNSIKTILWNNITLQKLLDSVYDKKYKTTDNQLIKIELNTTKPISKNEMLNVLKENYNIE